MNAVDGRLDLRVVRPLRRVTNAELAECSTWSKALEAACRASRLQDKSLAIEADIDPAMLSKIQSGQNGIKAEQLFRLMDACGSEFPLLWLLYQRGYDVDALRQRETELQAENRRLREQLEQERRERAVIVQFVREAKAA